MVSATVPLAVGAAALNVRCLMRVLWLLLAMLQFSCASVVPEARPQESLKMLTVENGRLAWAGLALGMTRAEAEGVLGRRIPVRYEPYNAEMCGDYYSDVVVRARSIHIGWSSAEHDGVIDYLAVPYTGGERVSYDSDLSRWAIESVPELINPHIEQDDACPPVSNSYLVLRSAPDDALNLKSSGEGVFYLTASGCVD